MMFPLVNRWGGDVKRFLFVLGIFIFSSSANANIVYQCQYAKADISNGTLGKLSVPSPANVEVDGKSIKTYRPDGTFIFSPPLTKANGPLMMEDDGSKVYAAANDRGSFAVSDKVAKITEQWDKCHDVVSIKNDKKPDEGVPVSGKELVMIKSLNGIEKLKCEKFLDKRFSLSKNIEYKILSSYLNKSPFIEGGEITCEVSSNIWNWDETTIMAVEHGSINGVSYNLYHSDGSGSVGYGDARWSLGCSVDVITGKKECTAYNSEMHIYKSNSGYSIVVGSNHFPGKSAYIRVNDGKASSTSNKGYFQNASKIIASINNRSKVVTRHTEWPYDYVIDKQINTDNFSQVKYLLDRVFNNK